MEKAKITIQSTRYMRFPDTWKSTYEYAELVQLNRKYRKRNAIFHTVAYCNIRARCLLLAHVCEFSGKTLPAT